MQCDRDTLRTCPCVALAAEEVDEVPPDCQLIPAFERAREMYNQKQPRSPQISMEDIADPPF
jgi:hypothetical protein